MTVPSISYAVGATALVLYLSLVRAIRYRRRDALQKRFPNRASYCKMTLDDAFDIHFQSSTLEFPAMFLTSLSFALFKTYGIPSVSSLLIQTGQLVDENASKRAADTEALMRESGLQHPGSQRHIDAIARTNFLHSRYRKAGKISDDDMLYTLGLFALEPSRWIARMEWRELSDVEKCAEGVWWQYMGSAMEIPYAALSSSGAGWSDGLHFLQDLEQWCNSYEARAMVPAESNRKLSRGTLDLLLCDVPARIRGFFLPILTTLMEPRLRRAMILTDPPFAVSAILHTIINSRIMFIRHLSPPRPLFLRVRNWSETPNEYGRINSKKYRSHPWYIEPTFLGRYGPSTWMRRLFGGVIPGDEHDKYFPKGYVVAEVGPEHLRDKGKEYMAEARAVIAEKARVGCPFGSM